jgi:hypothetical protein
MPEPRVMIRSFWPWLLFAAICLAIPLAAMLVR